MVKKPLRKIRDMWRNRRFKKSSTAIIAAAHAKIKDAKERALASANAQKSVEAHNGKPE